MIYFLVFCVGLYITSTYYKNKMFYKKMNKNGRTMNTQLFVTTCPNGIRNGPCH